MKLRPTIFLSGVSSEFRSFRDAAEIEVQKKDCFPINQPSFGVDYREIEQMLRARLSEADAVVHIVGFRFGGEPKDRPAGKPRRSYTQLEYDIARELEKPVYVFLSAEASVRDSDELPEDADAAELQLAHRQALQSLNNIYYTFRNKNELSNLVAGIPLLATADFRVDISRIDKYAPAELIGREDELKVLDDAWLKVRRAESGRPHILTFVALGGEGKTSLVAKWLANLAFQNWPGCDSAFAWSFYSQGTREQVAASSDLFLKEAITFFGNDDDKRFAASSAGSYEKGQRLARIVGNRRSLLILDGVEPLQYSPTSPTRSELKDAGLIALLKGLAADSDGLCLVTTRYSIPNLKAYWQTTAPERELRRLSRDAGVHLLKSLGVKGTEEQIEELVEDVKGHALTLNLLGTYLRDAHGGDIRRRDLVRFEEADAEEQGGHAFRVMAAYEKAFEAEGEKGDRALAILRLLGLFDRSVSADCLDALLEKPAISGLTTSLVGLNEAQRNLVFKRMEDAKLLTINREATGALISIDAHPLLREYFARQVRTKLRKAWRAAHRRVFEHLCTNTTENEKPTLEDLQPLYHAVAHGCEAGLEQKAWIDVYLVRICRFEEFYSTERLAAFASDLGALTCFFETPWSRVSAALKGNEASLLNITGFRLRALGRLNEALEPMAAGMKQRIGEEKWREAAIDSGNLSELELTLGKIKDAVRDAQLSVTYADRSGDAEIRMLRYAAYADALHQSGRQVEAETWFLNSLQIQVDTQPDYPLLYSLQGFLHCELLLSVPEGTGWERMLTDHQLFPTSGHSLSAEFAGTPTEKLREARSKALEVFRRAALTLRWMEEIFDGPLIDVGLHYISLCRASLYETVLSPAVSIGESSQLNAALYNAVDRLRRAGQQQILPFALLTRAWFRYIAGAKTGLQSAQEDLDEAWEIAERGPMRLHMADIHLYRARLFFRDEEYPWESAEADLVAARKLIEQCGYWRRKEELEDAERVILGKSV